MANYDVAREREELLGCWDLQILELNEWTDLKADKGDLRELVYLRASVDILMSRKPFGKGDS